MIQHPLAWMFATRMPGLFAGRSLHRAALHAATAGRHAAAETLFERAAQRYRACLEVESLARLRVHQLIARLRATAEPSRDAAMCLEVERRLMRLDWIDSPDAPFGPMASSELLMAWEAPPAIAPAAQARERRAA